MGSHMWILGFLLAIPSHCTASWGTPGLGQYHIQTDEGPERYFRYQTDSGQYRKEKRLQDGTVIGTDAWIDASGFLRQKDYIADNRGYRILKSKTIYVGKGRSIEEALKTAKGYPPQAGTLLKQGIQSSISTSRPSDLYTSTTPRTSLPPYTTRLAPTPYLGYDHYPTPNVFVRPHSQPIENNYVPAYGQPTTIRHPVPSPYYSTSTANPFNIPSRRFEAPYDNRVEPIAVYPATTTPAPITADYGPPIAAYPSSSTSPTTSPYTSTTYSSSSPTLPYSSTIRPNVHSSSFAPISSTTVPPPLELSTAKSITPLSNNNVDVQPLYTRPSVSSGNPYYGRYYPNRPLQYNNNLGSGYDPQFPLYDGVSVTNNGFRYYLPRQYHEEENIDSQTRAGSFGYIDPFGIRRVIYYNASPGQGFVHRKNNRYVGFNATPYDPRPL